MTSMTTFARALIVCATALGSSHTWAEDVTFSVDRFADIVEGRGNPYVRPGVAARQGTFTASEALLGMVNFGVSITADAQAPSVLTVAGAGGAGSGPGLSWSSRIDAITATSSYGEHRSYGGNWVALNAISLSGGMTLTAKGGDTVSTGGFVRMQNLRLDAVSSTIYADLDGGNGLESLRGVALWQAYSEQAVPAMNIAPFFLLNDCPGGCFNDQTFLLHTYQQLVLTDTAREFIGDALGLTGLGRAVMLAEPVFGSMTFEISVATVPEPSSWLMGMLGLTGIACAASLARRRSDIAMPAQS